MGGAPTDKCGRSPSAWAPDCPHARAWRINGNHPTGRSMRTRKLRRGIAGVALGAMLSGQFAAPIALAQGTAARNDNSTTTPITHLIVLIGENRTFDHTFATYRPKGS